MPSLYNSISYAPPRVSYWTSDVPPESGPFCIASKLTEDEREIWDAFDDMLMNEHLKKLVEDAKSGRLSGAQTAALADEFVFEPHSLRRLEAKKYINSVFLREAQFLRDLAKKVGRSNTQPIGGVPPQLPINRDDFLTK